MRPARPARWNAPAALAALAALGALVGCSAAGEPAGLARTAEAPQLERMYVLATVTGRALPARFLQLGPNVYRAHADTLVFDTATSTFRESAAIGGRDTTSAAAEAVSARALGPLPFERPTPSTVVLGNFLGLGRQTATIFDGGLAVVALGNRFYYSRVAR